MDAGSPDPEIPEQEIPEIPEITKDQTFRAYQKFPQEITRIPEIPFFIRNITRFQQSLNISHTLEIPYRYA